MKMYIRANTEKPKLDHVETVWTELEDGKGILFDIYSDDDELLFEEYFDYQDVDPDAVYDSAADMAIIALSQQYDLSDEVIREIKGDTADV